MKLMTLMQLKPIKSVLLSGLLLLLTPLAFGHGAESEPLNPHGGEAVHAGPYNLELLVEGTRLSLYVSDDHNHPVAVAGAQAEAVILANKQKTRLTLSHDDANRLVGQGSFAADPQMKVIVSLQLPGAKKVTGLFRPLQ